MMHRKIILSVLIVIFTASLASGQTEVLKNVVNNLAFYKQKKDLKYLAAAKKSVDSLIKNHADSVDLEKNVYKAVVYSSIVYIDSLNKLNQPANFFELTCKDVNHLSGNRNIYRYQAEMDYSKRCLTNVYIRKAFVYLHRSDFSNAIELFQKGQNYSPAFKELNAYIAYSNNKLGNLQAALKYYNNLLKTDSAKVEYIEAVTNIYKSIGDTAKALQTLRKGRKLLPLDKNLMLNEANVYINEQNYKDLEPLLNPLLEANPNNADIAYISASCYDHLNKFDKAETLYLSAIELNNTLYEPAYNLGLLYLKQGITKYGTDGAKNLHNAQQWLEKANEIAPNDSKCLEMLQFAYTQTGNQEQANKVGTQLKMLNN